MKVSPLNYLRRPCSLCFWLEPDYYWNCIAQSELKRFSFPSSTGEGWREGLGTC